VGGPEAGQVPENSSPKRLSPCVLAPPGQGPQGFLRSPLWARFRGIYDGEGSSIADYDRDRNDFNKRFKIREKAQAFAASEIVLGQPRFASPDVILYTDRSASAVGNSCDSLPGAYPHTVGPSRHCPTGLSMAWGRPTHTKPSKSAHTITG